MFTKHIMWLYSMPTTMKSTGLVLLSLGYGQRQVQSKGYAQGLISLYFD